MAALSSASSAYIRLSRPFSASSSLTLLRSDASMPPYFDFHDMALRFNYLSARRPGGVLNVVPATGSVTSGYLLSLTPDALAFVDRKEGHPDVYERRPVTVIAPGGALVPAMTYIVREELTEDFVKPSEHYLHICAEGRRSVGIETRSLFTASQNAPAHHLNSLFVYGTLQRGERLFSAASSYAVRCALLAQTRGELRSGGFFPALVPHQEHEARGRSKRIEAMPATGDCR